MKVSQERAELIVETLKTLGEPVSFKDLRDLTKDKIAWGANPDAQLNYAMKMPIGKHITRVAKGMYAYRDATDQEIEQAEPSHLGRERARIIKEALQYYGTLSLKDLIEKTKDKLDWKNQYGVMHYATKADPKIVKVGRGFYKYDEPSVTPTQNSSEIDKENEKLLNNFRNAAPSYYKYASNKDLRHPYRAGDKVTAKVTKLEPYGVFVDIIDLDDEQRNGFGGLIHQSNVRKGKYLQTTDIPKYFTVGDIIDAKVIAIRPDGKVGFETYDSQLPSQANDSTQDAVTSSYTPPTNPIMAEKLAPLASQIAVQREVTVPAAPAPQRVIAAVPQQVTEPAPVVVQVDDVTEQQFREIETYLNPLVGMVTPEAKQKLKELVKTFGMFKFSRLMTKAEEDFDKIDPSLAFARMMQDKAGEYL